MKYLICPAEKCKFPLWMWGCEQNGKIFHCEDCWKIPGWNHKVSCPKGTEIESRACSRHEGRKQ